MNTKTIDDLISIILLLDKSDIEFISSAPIGEEISMRSNNNSIGKTYIKISQEINCAANMALTVLNQDN